jgi:hypothetical protein
MSINSVSATPSVPYVQQPRTVGNTAQPTATQASTTQPPVAGQANPAPGQGAKAHHHHHRSGGAPAAEDPALAQSGTTASGGTSLLNTIV